MAQTVIGIFDSASEAQHAVERLTSSGFLRDRVDISLHNDSSHYASGQSYSADHDDGLGDKISRFFKSLFDDDNETSKYTTVAQRGAAVVTVTAETEEEAEMAADVLDECGAVDVDERSQAYANGLWSGSDSSNMSSDSDNLTTRTGNMSTGVSGLESDDVSMRNENWRSEDTSDRNRSIPIIEENLQVGKREVERGSVRLRSRIVERPVEETVRLREERVSIERNPVNRPAREGELTSFQEGEIELTERAEIPVVNKEARVVEEVRLNKEVSEREETIRDTVRKTEIDVDENHMSNEESLRSRRQDKDTEY